MVWPALRSTFSAAILSSSANVEASITIRGFAFASAISATTACSAFGLGRLVMTTGTCGDQFFHTVGNRDAGFCHLLAPLRIGIDACDDPPVGDQVARERATHDAEADNADHAFRSCRHLKPPLLRAFLAARVRYYMASGAGGRPADRSGELHASARLCHPTDCRKRAAAPEGDCRGRTQRRFQPYPGQRQADRCGQALRHPPVPAARHHRSRGAGRQSEPEGGRFDDDHARPYRRDGGDQSQDHRHQHSGGGDRCHRRYRIRAAARGGAPDRRGRPGGALRCVSGLAVEPSRRRGGERQDARHCRHGPDRAGGGAPRARFRHDDPVFRSARAFRGRGAGARIALGELRRIARPVGFHLAASATE